MNIFSTSYLKGQRETMSECAPIRSTWEKILEYASSPVHGTMSRKLRKGVKVQINGAQIISDAQIFIGELFARFTFKDSNGEMNNVYYDLCKITSIQTISKESE
jgi:hypothetical protein